MHKPQLGLAQACVKYGICSKADADRAMALCRQIESLGREGDVLSLLVEQGSITRPQAAAIVGGRAPGARDEPEDQGEGAASTVAFSATELAAYKEGDRSSHPTNVSGLAFGSGEVAATERSGEATVSMPAPDSQVQSAQGSVADSPEYLALYDEEDDLPEPVVYAPPPDAPPSNLFDDADIPIPMDPGPPNLFADDEATGTVAFDPAELNALKAGAAPPDGGTVAFEREELTALQGAAPEDPGTLAFDESDVARASESPPPSRGPAPTVAVPRDDLVRALAESEPDAAASHPPPKGRDPTVAFNRADMEVARHEDSQAINATRAFSPADRDSAAARSVGPGNVTDAADPSATQSRHRSMFGKDLIGLVLGGCSIQREIGRGAWAVVFEATHLSLQRPVAIKVMMPNQRGKAAADLLIREARSLARIEHINIVQVFDVGNEQNLPYIVMQLFDGLNLSQYLDKKGALTWQEACQIALGIAQGLAVAHDKGIVHRDVKPANVLLSKDNVPKIADFGLAAPFIEDDRPSDEVMGTPAYMSPEQIDGRQVDGRADLYSLGCTLYEMLTGRKPFTGRHALEVVLKQTTEQAVPVHKLVPSIPVSVSGVVRKCMAKQPDARYTTAGELASDLEKVLGGGKPKVVGEIEDVMSRMETLIAQAPQPGSQYRPAGVVAAAAVLIGSLGVGLTFALPAFDAPTVSIELPTVEADKATSETDAAWAALVKVEGYARDNPGDPDGVETRYKEVFKRYGDLLGSQIEDSRNKTARALLDARRAAFDKVRRNAEIAIGKADLVGAARILDEFPVDMRQGAPAERWREMRSELHARIREEEKMAYVPPERHPETAGTDESDRGFLIDLAEVSNGQYARFVRATQARVPLHWEGPTPPPELETLPVVGITAAEAAAYAEFKGKRLPTSDEWERAASGDGSRLYPWGAVFDASRCAARGGSVGRLVDVSSLEGGRTLQGAYHMAGNAIEWTSDSSDDALEGIGQIVRGGSVRSHPGQCTTRFRYTVPPDSNDPLLFIGFRCVKDVR